MRCSHYKHSGTSWNPIENLDKPLYVSAHNVLKHKSNFDEEGIMRHPYPIGATVQTTAYDSRNQSEPVVGRVIRVTPNRYTGEYRYTIELEDGRVVTKYQEMVSYVDPQNVPEPSEEWADRLWPDSLVPPDTLPEDWKKESGYKHLAMSYDDNTWWHVTSPDRVDDILQNGLYAGRKAQPREFGGGWIDPESVYLFSDPQRAREYGERKIGPNYQMLQIQELDPQNLSPDPEDVYRLTDEFAEDRSGLDPRQMSDQDRDDLWTYMENAYEPEDDDEEPPYPTEYGIGQFNQGLGNMSRDDLQDFTRELGNRGFSIKHRGWISPEKIRKVAAKRNAKTGMAERSGNEPPPGPYYHGTNVELQSGDTLYPAHMGFESFHGDVAHYTPNQIYLTTEPHLAERFAIGRAGRLGGDPHIYEVRPVGDISRDPEYLASGFGSDQVVAPMGEIVREHPLPGLVRWNPEINAMERIPRVSSSPPDWKSQYHYRHAEIGGHSCKGCGAFKNNHCKMFDAKVKPDYVCGEWISPKDWKAEQNEKQQGKLSGVDLARLDSRFASGYNPCYEGKSDQASGGLQEAKGSEGVQALNKHAADYEEPEGSLEPSEYQWPALEHVVSAAQDPAVVENFQGIRDERLLDSAIGAAKNQEAYGAEDDVFNLAAHLINNIQRQQAIVEGNKRTATAIGVGFLESNGYPQAGRLLDAANPQWVDNILRMAEGEISPEQLGAFMRSVVTQKLSSGQLNLNIERYPKAWEAFQAERAQGRLLYPWESAQTQNILISVYGLSLEEAKDVIGSFWASIGRTAGITNPNALVAISRAQAMYQALIASGGFTATLDLTAAEFASGYQVSVFGHEAQIPLSQITPIDIIDHLMVLISLEKPQSFLGGWADSGLAYLDLSLWFSDILAAEAAGIAEHQIGIYDWKEGRTRMLGKDGRYAADHQERKWQAIRKAVEAGAFFDISDLTIQDLQDAKAILEKEQQGEDEDESDLDWEPVQPRGMAFAHLAMALDPSDMDAYIQKYGPYLYHWTSPENVELILQNGIQPWTDRAPDEYWDALENEEDYEPQDNWGGFLETRPGHVYLAGPEYDVSWWKNHRGERPYRIPIGVDIRKLDLSKLKADEDVAQKKWLEWADKAGETDPDWKEEMDFNIPPESHLWEGGMQGLGDWAEREGLGEPEWVADSLREGTIAHEGTIPPEALVYPISESAPKLGG